MARAAGADMKAVGALGGRSTYARHGSAHMASIGARGWAALVANKGVDAAADRLHQWRQAHPGSLDHKLAAAHNWMHNQIDRYGPSILGIETPFFKLNAQTMHTLSSLGAAFRLAATLRAVRVVAVTPAGRCTAIGLGGNAEKLQVLYTVNAIFGLELTNHNISDAVAIAAAAALKLREEILSQ